MSIDKNEITMEMLEKAMQCETPEELSTLKKDIGISFFFLYAVHK